MKLKANIKLEPEEYYMSLWRYPTSKAGNFQKYSKQYPDEPFDYELLWRRFKNPARSTYKSIAIENNLIVEG